MRHALWMACLFLAPDQTQRRALYDDRARVALLREGKTHDGHAPWGMPIRMFQHPSDREVRDIPTCSPTPATFRRQCRPRVKSPPAENPGRA